ncbi:MAG TPA: class I SAM-dependent methyltransferase [Candidatus Ozemobacteraceae bacterium]|nr:class I SAM-dependent methyltransferase [Candidatus Ozemobacteraceae bacterium]
MNEQPNPNRDLSAETQSRTYWDKTWSKFLKYQGMIAPSGKLIQLLIGMVERGGTVLDLGCGEGRNTIYMARVGFRVVGLDLSQKGVRVLANNLFEEEVRATALVGDTRRLPFALGSFDAILAHNLFDHVDAETSKIGLQECYRVLKPGGYLLLTWDSLPQHLDRKQIVTCDDGSHVYTTGSHKGMLLRPWSAGELAATVEQGWDVIKDELTPRQSKVLLWRKKLQHG